LLIVSYQVSKHAAQEEQLRNKLGDDVQWLGEVLVVVVGENDAKEHVQHSDNDGEFHFKSIQEDDFVFRDLQII